MASHRSEGLSRLKIYCNSRLSATSLKLLQEGVAPHELIYPEADTVSGLGASTHSLEGIHVAFGQPDPEAMFASDTLQWAHISSAGITRYDTPLFRKAWQARGGVLTNSSGVYDEPCAEHVLAFMMAANRNLPMSLSLRCDHRSPLWQELRETCPLLSGQTALILGYGAIAQRLVELLAPFRMKLIGYRRTPRGDEAIEMIGADKLKDALKIADHVINILPDNEETRTFFNRDRFAQMKSGAVFYNIGRGTTVDQSVLADVLEYGSLGAAWLDVTDPEPLPEGHRLLTLPNCHITPHVAGGHCNERDTLVTHFLENFRRFIEGQPLLDRVI